MRHHLFAFSMAFGLVILLPIPVQAQAQDQACLDLANPKNEVGFTGMLTTQLFAGPPNYESIAAGDAEERAFILELPNRLCASDGGLFLDPENTFDRVHVSSSDPSLIPVFSAAIGKQVTVRGEAFGAHTGHHHAPIVVIATEILVQ